MLATALIASCTPSSPSAIGGGVDGNNVARAIDSQIGMDLKSFDPRLDVAASRCPKTVDVSDGKTATCTIDVDGTALPVSVSYAAPPQNYSVRLPGYFYERRMIESLVSTTTDDTLGGRHEAHCAMPPYAVMPSGAKFKCAIAGGPKPLSIAMTTAANGRIDLGDLPGRPPPTALERRIAAEHAAGEATIVPGSLVAPMIDRMVGAVLQAMPGGPTSVGHARCPDELDLTGAKHGQCYVPIGDERLREDISLESSGGYHMQPLDAVIDMRQLAANAERSINASLAARGSADGAMVACQGTIVVVPAPSDLYCDAQLSTQRARLQVHVLDARGEVQYRFVPIASPAPH